MFNDRRRRYQENKSNVPTKPSGVMDAPLPPSREYNRNEPPRGPREQQNDNRYRDNRYRDNRYRDNRYMDDRYKSESHRNTNYRNGGHRQDDRRSEPYRERERDTRRNDDRRRYQQNGYDNRQRDGRRQNFKAPPLATLYPNPSLWDIVPDRVKGMSARFAKSVGLFTASSNILKDFTDEKIKELLDKQAYLERVRKDAKPVVSIPLTNALYSRMIVVKNGELSSVRSYMEDFLTSSVIPGVSYEDIGLTFEEIDDIVVVECVNDTIATTLMSLNGKIIGEKIVIVERHPEYVADAIVNSSSEDIKSTDKTPANDKETGESNNREETLKTESGETNDKPANKVTQVTEINNNKTSTESTANSGPAEVIMNKTSLICANNAEILSTQEYISILSKYGNLYSFVCLLDKLSYDSNGTLFFSFKSSEKPIQEIIDEMSKTLKWNFSLPCHSKYKQSETLTLRNLRQFVDAKTETVTAHAITKTIQLINIISLADSINDFHYKKTFETFEEELQKMPGFVDFMLVAPTPEFKPTIDVIRPEYTRLYIKFDDAKNSTACLESLCGRTYNGRLILGGYIDELDYKRIESSPLFSTGKKSVNTNH